MIEPGPVGNKFKSLPIKLLLVFERRAGDREGADLRAPHQSRASTHTSTWHLGGTDQPLFGLATEPWPPESTATSHSPHRTRPIPLCRLAALRARGHLSLAEMA